MCRPLDIFEELNICILRERMCYVCVDGCRVKSDTMSTSFVFLEGDNTVFTELTYLGSATVDAPRSEMEINRNMRVLNTQSKMAISVTLSVPAHSDGIVRLAVIYFSKTVYYISSLFGVSSRQTAQQIVIVIYIVSEGNFLTLTVIITTWFVCLIEGLFCKNLSKFYLAMHYSAKHGTVLQSHVVRLVLSVIIISTVVWCMQTCGADDQFGDCVLSNPQYSVLCSWRG